MADAASECVGTYGTIKILKRKQYLEGLEKARLEREEKARKEEATLKTALAARSIVSRTTSQPPDMEDAAISLEDPTDPASNLRVPALFLYPVHEQHLVLFPPPPSVALH